MYGRSFDEADRSRGSTTHFLRVIENGGVDKVYFQAC